MTDTDWQAIPPSQEATHLRLVNWARWCHGSSGRTCQPMFRHYRPEGGYIETTAPSSVDTRDAVAVQNSMSVIPERNRLAIGYFYVFPGRSLPRVLRQLGVSKAGLGALVSDGRVMLRNIA